MEGRVDELDAERDELKAKVERLRANRDFWHQACLQAQEHRDGASASNAVWEAETVKLRAEVERLRAALENIEHATAPTHDDGGYHENAYTLARNALKEPK
jgi:uncharacterized coiled-coil DUF342 family protein